MRAAVSVLTVLAAAFAMGQRSDGSWLTVGDPAPEFKIAGTVKGDKVSKLEKGQVYVIEFWATWCGPCIASMPHLSEMADSMKGKATFLSVNVWDRRGPNNTVEPNDAHVKRVNEWVTTNTEKMRYNVVLDGEDEFMSKSWLFAAGRNGIPCAFIVNEEGKVAWIGHPMASMDKVLEEVTAKTWDMAAYKAKFEKEMADQRESLQAQKELTALIKASDWTGVYSKLDSAKNKANFVPMAVSLATRSNPGEAMKLLEKYAGKVDGIKTYMWCSMAAGVAGAAKDESTKAAAVKLSAECCSMSPEAEGALANIYHARVLFAAGNKQDALSFADKAAGLVDKYEPANQRESLKKFIDQMKASFGS